MIDFSNNKFLSFYISHITITFWGVVIGGMLNVVLV